MTEKRIITIANPHTRQLLYISSKKYNYFLVVKSTVFGIPMHLSVVKLILYYALYCNL